MFYCEYCKTFKNTYFEEYLQTAASESFSFYDVTLNVFLHEKITTKYTRSEEDIFSKMKQKKTHSKTQVDEKSLPFHDVLHEFVFLYFSTARQAAFALQNKRVKDFKTALQ